MLKISFEPPKIGIAEDVKNVLRGEDAKKREHSKKVFTWTRKDRMLVGIVLALTVLLSIALWYKGNSGKLPQVKFGGFGFNETVILEK